MWIRGWATAAIALAVVACESASEGPPVGASASDGGTTTAGTMTSDPTTSTTMDTESTTMDSATSMTSMTSMTTMSTTDATTDGTDATTDATSSGTSSSDGSTGSVPGNCTDGMLTDDETDVDCGGSSCPGCDFGQMCNDNGDCLNNTCDNGTTCILPEPTVWLDGRDTTTMYTNNGCTQNNPNIGEDVDCWGNKGSFGGNFVDDGSRGVYDGGGGVDLSDDTYIRQGVFNGALGSVMVFVVLEEVNAGNAYVFNLNHPETGGGDRYTAQVPNDGQNRRVIWEPGGSGNVVESGDDAFGFGTEHITVLENSGFAAQRAIYIDGVEVAQQNGAVAPTASDVSIGNGGDMIIREFRIYSASLGPLARQEVEGDLACRWNLRDLLPNNHPYYDADGSNNAGCP